MELVVTPELVARFWQKVEFNPGGCWEWTGAFRGAGYGSIGIEGKVCDVHRVVAVFAYGSIPPGYLACHSCDNRRCVKPGHIFLGTHRDNMRDMAEKGRRYAWSTRPQDERLVVSILKASGSGAGATWIARQLAMPLSSVKHVTSRRRKYVQRIAERHGL